MDSPLINSIRHRYAAEFKLENFAKLFEQRFVGDINQLAIINRQKFPQQTLYASNLAVPYPTWNYPLKGRKIRGNIQCQTMMSYPLRHLYPNGC